MRRCKAAKRAQNNSSRLTRTHFVSCGGVIETIELWEQGGQSAKLIGQKRPEYLICADGKLAGVGAHSYTASNSTGGSAEAAKFKQGK